MKKQSRVTGVAISYITTIVRTLSKLLLTPIYLKVLGLDDYGFYQYVFSVAEWATKSDVASAVESFFNVKVAAVNVINAPGKAKRIRSKTSRKYSVVSRGRKAVVRLKDGCKIDLS